MLGGQVNPARAQWSRQRPSQCQSDIGVGKCLQKTALAGWQEAEIPELLFLPLNNMERFLWAISPSVPAQYISKTTVRDCKTCDVDYHPYFLLADLWESYKEWSAYGAGVPLLFDDNDYAVQYYVPYLSAIQIFADPSKSPSSLRRGKAKNEGESIVKDSISEGRSVSERERTLTYSRRKPISNHPTLDVSSIMENLSLKDQQTGAKKGLSSDDSRSVNSQGSLLFQYLEHDTPFAREPLHMKISKLALDFPELKNLRSCDLLSSSWYSVAWYPIYRIPTGPAMKDLEACFLTYHSLFTPLADDGSEEAPLVLTYPNDIPKIPLPSFGLSTYKYRESMWTSGCSSRQNLVNLLLEAASDWLDVLQVHPPDYNFFASRR